MYTKKYVTEGNSKWIVFLHGIGGSSATWRKQVSVLKSEYNILLFDLPGHGESKLGCYNKGITTFEEIGDLIVEKMKEEGIDKATFICLSLGTLVFAGVLKNHSEVVEGAILCGAVAGMNAFFELVVQCAYLLCKIIPYEFLMDVAGFAMLPKKSHKVFRNFFLRSAKRMGDLEFRAWFRLLAKDAHILKSLKGYNNNILFVTGSEDYTFKTGVKHKLNDFVNSKLKIMKNCSHVCLLQRSDEFNDIMLNYLHTEMTI